MRCRIQNTNHEEQKAEALFIHSESLKEPIGEKRIGEKASTAGIQREESGDPANDSFGLRCDLDRSDSLDRFANLNLIGEEKIKCGGGEIDDGVSGEDPSVSRFQIQPRGALKDDGQGS